MSAGGRDEAGSPGAGAGRARMSGGARRDRIDGPGGDQAFVGLERGDDSTRRLVEGPVRGEPLVAEGDESLLVGQYLRSVGADAEGGAHRRPGTLVVGRHCGGGERWKRADRRRAAT